MPKFLAERRTERGERNHAGCACNALKRFGEGSGPEPGPLRSLNQRIHDTAHSTGGSGKRHPGEAFGSLVDDQIPMRRKCKKRATGLGEVAFPKQ